VPTENVSEVFWRFPETIVVGNRGNSVAFGTEAKEFEVFIDKIYNNNIFVFIIFAK